MADIHPLKPKSALTLGHVLKSELSRLGISQGDLADMTGVSTATINNLARDLYPVSSLNARKFAKVFDRSVDYWLKTSFTATDLLPTELGQKLTALSNNFGRLSDRGIQEYVEAGDLGIEPFEPKLLQPASIDLRAGSKIIMPDGRNVDLSKASYYMEPGEIILLETLERLTLAKTIAGNIGGMARYARQFLTYGLGYEIDPGFSGRLTFTLSNNGVNRFRLYEGMPIITVMFYRLAQKGSTEIDSSQTQQTHYHRRPNNNDRISETIRKAFEENVQSVERAGYFEYSIKGTMFSFTMRDEVKKAELFEIFLQELSEVIKEKVSKKKEYVEAFLGAIPLSIQALHVDVLHLERVLAENQGYQEGMLEDTLGKHVGKETITLNALSKELYLDAVVFTLSIFKAWQGNSDF